jgi:N-acetylmuramoyl-L-alanine amidase
MIKVQLKKKISLFYVLAILSVFLLPLLIIVSQEHQTAYANTSPSSENTSSLQVTVTASDLNVRESGDVSSQIIGLVHQGETFKIIQSKNSWDQIKLSSNQTGWVNNAYVTMANEKTKENIAATVEAIVLNVRENPSLSSQVVGQLKFGTQITLHEEKAGWSKIVSSSGVQGWVYEYYITKNAPSDHQTPPVTLSTTTHTKIFDPSQLAKKRSLFQSSAKLSRSLGGHTTAQSIKTGLTQNSYDPLKGRTIVLDPGHGGIDDGTSSQITGTNEKALTLATAKVVEQKLENAGAHVIMTRTTDSFISLQQRADLSNQNHADAFISFHYNWSNDLSINGVTDFYYQQSKDNPLASDILNEVIKTTGLQNDGTRFDNLYVLRNNSQPCTLIELGFLSNQHDDSVVESSDYNDKIAQGVYQGLVNYFSLKK